MSDSSKKPSEQSVAILGGGPMGLAAAYELLKRGKRVTLYEAGPRLGGMSAAFDFGGLTIDRHFHFLCKTDFEYFRVLKELGIDHALKWRQTKMGMYHDSRLQDWGDPQSLLTFPGLPLSSKVRYGAMVLAARRRDNFDDLDAVNARSWLKRWIGRRGYKVLWEPLLAGKFHQHQGNVSAAWIAARIQRVGRSRNRAMQEELGYLEGGSETLIAALGAEVERLGGDIQLRAPVDELPLEQGRVVGVRLGGQQFRHSRVISTVPLPILLRRVQFPPDKERILGSVEHLGVVTLIMKLRHSLTPYFWTNISDESVSLPGIIEFSNLNPLGTNLVYVPFYMPRDHARYSASHEELMAEVMGVFARVNPAFRPDWVLESNSSRYAQAQAICTPGFSAKVPPLDGWVPGLSHADTTAYYPQDRSISESMLTGRRLAERVDRAT